MTGVGRIKLDPTGGLTPGGYQSHLSSRVDLLKRSTENLNNNLSTTQTIELEQPSPSIH